jgi:hypothetical protein
VSALDYAQVTPDALAAYLSTDWVERPSRNERIRRFTPKGEEADYGLLIPAVNDSPDYGASVAWVVELLARVEDRAPSEVLRSILGGVK